MKKLTGSTPAKIAAFILSFVMVFVFVVTTAGTVVMVYYKFYFSNEETVKQEVLTDMAEGEAQYISYRMSNYMNLESYYKDKNVYYVVEDIIDGDRSQSNYNGEKYIATAECPYYIYNDVVYTDESGNLVTTFDEVHAANITVYIAEDMTKNDMFSVVSKIIHIGFKLQYFAILIALLSLGFAITLICYLFCAAGHTAGGEIKFNYLDKLPIDIYICAMVFAAIGSVIIVANWSSDVISAIILMLIVGSIDYFLALGFLLSVATRIKTGTLIKNSLIYRLLYLLYKGLKKPFKNLKYIISNLTLIKKTVLIICGLVLVEFIGIIIAYNIMYWYEDEFLIIPLIIINIIVILALLYIAVILQKIKQGGEKIAAGDLDHKIDTQYMFGDFKEFSESLNNINDGLQSAVNERMKSERFKTELITNVSHDIKTPLTSIINYVDLIKKEEIGNETVKGYIDVLDRQSGRLKKLVEDLVEASKASSGSLSVELMPCNVGVLLTQTIGEFEDRLHKAQIQPVLKMNDTDTVIMADGRHLWRVFDNLLNNVCKYALAGTRVYIDVVKKNRKAVITFRNISRFELNITTDELFERFVRGDKSRNTEGSGLGLSIAKSLVELQGGKLDLAVDGDLFKATITFEII